MRPLKPWHLVAAYALGALTFGPAPTLPTGWPGIAWILPVAGPTADFKADAPYLLCVADMSPSAVKEFDIAHPGMADIFSSDAEGSTHDWLRKNKGEFRIVDKSIPPPAKDKQWVQDAYAAWKAKGGKYPWVVAAGPTGKGFNQTPPETQAEMLAMLKPLIR